MAFIGNLQALSVAVRSRETQSPDEYAIGERDATAFITARILALPIGLSYHCKHCFMP